MFTHIINLEGGGGGGGGGCHTAQSLACKDCAPSAPLVMIIFILFNWWVQFVPDFISRL